MLTFIFSKYKSGNKQQYYNNNIIQHTMQVAEG